MIKKQYPVIKKRVCGKVLFGKQVIFITTTGGAKYLILFASILNGNEKNNIINQ